MIYDTERSSVGEMIIQIKKHKSYFLSYLITVCLKTNTYFQHKATKAERILSDPTYPLHDQFQLS